MTPFTRRAYAYICDEYGLTVEELQGRGRTHRVAHPRQLLMLIIYRGGVSMPGTGREVGGRDHTTVLHAVRTVEKRDPELYAAASDVAAKLRELAARDVAEQRVDYVTAPPSVQGEGRSYVHGRLSKRYGRRTPLKVVPVDRVASHQHLQPFAAKWVADGGTPGEALEPYGLSASEVTEFLRRYLPTLLGKNGQARCRAARECLPRIELGKRLAGVAA
jgi:hypothetical protein